MNVKYRVELDQDERERLAALSSGGKIAVRRLKRIQILLAADAGVDDAGMATSLGLSGSTIYRTKRRFVEEGLGSGPVRAASAGWRPQAVGPRRGSSCRDGLLGGARWPQALDVDLAGRRHGEPDGA